MKEKKQSTNIKIEPSLKTAFKKKITGNFSANIRLYMQAVVKGWIDPVTMKPKEEVKDG